MIIRARPKYLQNIQYTDEPFLYEKENNEFYFSTGRAALKFFLINLSHTLNKKINIAMQAFNCNVVADAALESNCKVFLQDITLNDFSVSLDSIKKLPKEIDALLLTHYQGIPNNDYIEIIEYCNAKNILVIEDLAQSYGSSINGIKIGSLGNLTITSYAFDKPFSTFKGGGLTINNISKKLQENIEYEYYQLEQETLENAKLDLDTLMFLYKYSTDKNYYKGINNYNYIRTLFSIKIPEKIIFHALSFSILYRVIKKLVSSFSKNSEETIKILRLSDVKIGFLKKQELNYHYDKNCVEWIEKLALKTKLSRVKNSNSDIHWNRYSILDEKKELLSVLKTKNIEAGNFNWPTTLDIDYQKNINIEQIENLQNSHFASKNILNIPIWSNDDK